MLLGMGIMAFLCIFIGLYPYPLYQILPYPVDFDAYTAPHVIEITSTAVVRFVCLLPSHNLWNISTGAEDNQPRYGLAIENCRREVYVVR